MDCDILILPRRRLRPTTRCRRSSGWTGGPTDSGESHSASRCHSHSRRRSDPITCALDFSKDDASTESTRGLRHLNWLIPQYVRVAVIERAASPLINTQATHFRAYLVSIASSVRFDALPVCVHARRLCAVSEVACSSECCFAASIGEFGGFFFLRVFLTIFGTSAAVFASSPTLGTSSCPLDTSVGFPMLVNWSTGGLLLPP